MAGGRKLSIVTDTGKIGDVILEEIRDADTIVMEANHEEELLLIGRYPYYLKRRILSDKGHLSNRAAAQALCQLPERDQRQRTVLFAHLSKENNFPESVMQTVGEIFPQGEHFAMDILLRDQISCIYMV
jgi:phosphoribosyl 1,2-cyclic phosphodiesterase